jgi:hypothetical protein
MFGWLIEHVISAFPEYVWTFMVAGGSLAIIVSGLVIRLIGPTGLAVRIVGIVAYTVGVFMMGGVGINIVYQERIKEMQAQVERAVEQSDQANAELQKKIDRKNKKIKEIKNESKALIRSNRVEIDRDCSVPDVAVRLHNNSASQSAISKDARRP